MEELDYGEPPNPCKHEKTDVKSKKKMMMIESKRLSAMVWLEFAVQFLEG